MKVDHKMTNAEKLAKDTNFLAILISRVECHICPAYQRCRDNRKKNIDISCKEEIKEWLEREVEEDETD